MPRHLFFYYAVLICVLSICSCSSGAATDDQKGAVGPLKGTTSIDGAKWEEMQCVEGSVTSLRVPSLVEVDGDVFAVAEAQYKKKGSEEAVSVAGIASVLLKEGEAGPTEISTVGTSFLHMQLLKGSDAAEKATEIMQPTTIVVGNDVYMLLGNYSRTTPKAEASGKDGWKLLLVKGTVSRTSNEEKKIQWGETHAVQLESRIHGSLTRLVGGGGSGVVLQDGSLVFPMQATDTKNGKGVFLAMQLTQVENKWELSRQMAEIGGYRDPAIVEWDDDEKLLALVPCKDGYYDVYKGLGAGRSWHPVREPISRVWGNSLKRQGEGVRSGFITAAIEDKKVMLLTLPAYSEEKGKGQLHLWVTDNARVHDVGPVSNEEHDAAASSLLYRKKRNKEDELVLLYEKKNDADDSFSLVSVRLTDKLPWIKEVVKTWKEMDAALKSCTSGGTFDPRAKGMCNGPIPTEGLVGFLSNTLTDGTDAGTVWVDEYLGVNATVKTGELASDEWGVTFKGVGAGRSGRW
ncbi:trans-sialidase, partial [Trypanosoma rangeli]